MSTILWILVIAAVIGGIIGIISGDNPGEVKENALGGAMAGAWMAGGCLVNLLIYGLVVAVGIWLFTLIFA